MPSDLNAKAQSKDRESQGKEKEGNWVMTCNEDVDNESTTTNGYSQFRYHGHQL